MAYFRNRPVNLLNLHYGIHAIAMSGGGAFFAIYLLTAGVSIPRVLVACALILLGRFVIRPLVIDLAMRWGLRAMVIGGAVLSATQYPFLAEVRGADLALASVIAIAAVGDAIYWTSYHAYFAALGDDELRGRQIGVREAVGAAVGVATPLAAGWLLVTCGPRVAFGATALIAAVSALPLLRAPNVAVAPRAPGAYRAAKLGLLLFAADGWTAAGYLVAWQIALFASLGESFIAYGGALALAALVGAVASLTLGRHIDAGFGHKAVWYAYLTLALVIVLRATATRNATLAVLANALGALAGCLYIPTVMTAVYTLAKRAPCPLRYHVAAEGGWDAGGAAGLVLAAAATACGLPLSACILVSLLGVSATALMLRRYYAALPVNAIAGA